MYWLLAALGTAFCFGISNTLFKWGATKNLSKVCIQFFFHAIAFVIVLSVAIIRDDFHPTLITASIGVLIGICNANGNLQMTRAFEKGPASITSTLIAMNAVVVILATAIFFPESIPMLHWFGIALMLGAAMVVQMRPSQQVRIEYGPWLSRCAFALLSVGSVGFLMKVATNEHVDFFNMLVAMYAGGLFFLGVLVRKELPEIAKRRLEIRTGLVVGFTSTIGYTCYLYALKTGPASVVFPVISLNCIVVMIAGLLIFKERLRFHQLLGMVVALCGLVLTKI